MKHQNKCKTIILIPSFEPNSKLLSYVSQLRKHDHIDIIMIDDGSGQDYQWIFNKLARGGCAVLHHPENLGKGCALKTGFAYIKENYKAFACVVMVDSDGQHSVGDVMRMASLSKKHPHALTLGVRDFTTPGIPVKSLLGNRFASFVFASLYGKSLPDTQTGLRAFGMPLLGFMTSVKGKRFEYEMEMLIACVQASIPMEMIPIQVIYENDNEGTHFRPFHDSIRVMGTLFDNFTRFLLSSITSAVVDLGIAWFLLDFLQPLMQSEYLRILVATGIARGISIGVNYLLNRKFVFKGKEAASQSLSRYLLLSILLILLSATGVYGLNRGFGISEKIGKITCDALLFLLSYQIQQKWVFGKGGQNHD